MISDNIADIDIVNKESLSSSGPGYRPLKPKTEVRILLGTPKQYSMGYWGS